jgi:ribosomal protein L11 methylase PrmA
MDIFDKLVSASTTKENLSSFLDDNIQELYDFLLTQKFEELNAYKDNIESYILENLNLIRQLDFSIRDSVTFTTLLLDVSERFSFFMAFQRLYRLLSRNGCEIGNRLQASSLFLVGINEIGDYQERISTVLAKLSESYENEEDNEDRVVGTVVSYYSQVVNNFANQNLNGVLRFRATLISYSDTFYFLKNTTIQSILSIDITNNIVAFNEIQNQLDTFLKRTKTYSSFIKGFLIEENTDYSLLLEKAQPNFHSIRQVSVKKWRKINDDSVRQSLRRGVEILTQENQLYSYLYSYGNMHHSKMTSSFDFLSNKLFSSDSNIIDWGCGQGLASISFLSYFNENISDVKNVTLIEPSELALKRASLHVKKIDEKLNISTINKDLDSLIKNDFNNKISNIKIHLFSNILDIDLFSLTQLVELIKNTFKGINYFVCASPYANTLKISRLDSFVNSFSTKENFKLIKEINNRKGEWDGENWTRAIRVFKVEI